MWNFGRVYIYICINYKQLWWRVNSWESEPCIFGPLKLVMFRFGGFLFSLEMWPILPIWLKMIMFWLFCVGEFGCEISTHQKNESQENIGRVDYILHDHFIAKSRVLLLLLVADEKCAVITTSKTCTSQNAVMLNVVPWKNGLFFCFLCFFPPKRLSSRFQKVRFSGLEVGNVRIQ